MTETSLVVVVYTRTWGKVRLAAKGARRPKSRFGAAFQPITFGSYVYYRKDGRDLQTVSEGDIQHTFDGVKQDYERLGYASAVCDLLDHMTVDEDPNAFLLSITLDALRWMEVVPSALMELPLWYFQVKAAGCLGYRPQFSGCAITGERFGPSIPTSVARPSDSFWTTIWMSVDRSLSSISRSFRTHGHHAPQLLLTLRSAEGSRSETTLEKSTDI
jgi:DNA repair protein RecO